MIQDTSKHICFILYTLLNRFKSHAVLAFSNTYITTYTLDNVHRLIKLHITGSFKTWPLVHTVQHCFYNIQLKARSQSCIRHHTRHSTFVTRSQNNAVHEILILFYNACKVYHVSLASARVQTQFS